MEAFRYLNPFENAAVHEDDVWSDERSDRFDVESVHADVSRVLLDDLRHVAARRATRVRFLVGSPGIGKSHLFSRLRRQLAGEAAFAFASIPPTRADALPYWVLDRVISGLQHRRLLDGELRTFSQLDALIYRLLIKHDSALRDQSEDITHEILTDADPQERDHYLTDLRNTISTPDAGDELIGGLLHVLRPESRRLALRWLSGTPNLTGEDLARIGQASPLDDSGVRSLLVLIGRLADLAKLPIVLALDQLDLMTEPAQIDAFQDLLFMLIGKSFNWYVVTGLNLPRYEGWVARFTEPFMTRLRAQAGGMMPTIELLGVSDHAQKQALLERRLADEPLASTRKSQGIAADVFPLLPEDIVQLVSSREPIAPRSLLTQAAAVYERRVRGLVEPASAQLPLTEAVKAEYERRRARLSEEHPNLDRAALADRVTEVVRLVAIKLGRGEIMTRVGPLEGSGPHAGTHNVFTVDHQDLHVVGHHMHKCAAFPTFAQKVLALPPGAVFVRAAAASTSGAKSTAVLQQLRARHAFVALTNPDLADLEALAQLLADLRAGDLRSLNTVPAPTDEAVLQAAAHLSLLETLPLAEAIRQQLTAARSAQPGLAFIEKSAAARAPRADPEREPQSYPTLAPIVREIMRPLRWLAVERLSWILRRQHQIHLGTEELGRLLRMEAYRGMFEIHPTTLLSPGLPQIVIFVEGERA